MVAPAIGVPDVVLVSFPLIVKDVPAVTEVGAATVSCVAILVTVTITVGLVALPYVGAMPAKVVR